MLMHQSIIFQLLKRGEKQRDSIFYPLHPDNRKNISFFDCFHASLVDRVTIVVLS